MHLLPTYVTINANYYWCVQRSVVYERIRCKLNDENISDEGPSLELENITLD